MFELPLHPKIVHIPIALAVLMPLISIGLLVAWWREWLPGKTWAIVTALQAVLVAGGFLAMNTGEDDEEKVEKVLASEEPIHEHEEAAELFTYTASGVLVVSLLPLLVPGENRRKILAAVTAAGTVVVFYLGYRVGDLGGDLVYEHGAADAWIQQVAPAGGSGEQTEHDE